jgi:hypothetical protein
VKLHHAITINASTGDKMNFIVVVLDGNALSGTTGIQFNSGSRRARKQCKYWAGLLTDYQSVSHLSHVLPTNITRWATATLSASERRSGRREAAEHSPGMPRVLRWARTLPSLRTLRLKRVLTTADDQAVALSSALTAYGAMPQSRSTATLAGRRQFFIHLVGISK